MAKGKGQINGWITKNGVHIPIYGHYSVRGGVEPKAKGAKFKSAKVTAKTVSKALKKEYDEDSKETWYEGKINGKDVRITQETAGSNKFWNVDIGKPGDRHKLLTDNNEPMSFKSLEDAHDEIAYELNSDNKSTNVSKEKKPKRGMTAAELDTANKELDAKDESEHLKKWEGQYDKAIAEGATVKKDKKYDFSPDKNSKNVGRNVLGQEVDWDKVDRTAKEREKDFIVNTKIPDDPKSIAKAEKQRKAMEAADEADAYDRQHKEGKYAEAEAYQKSGQLSNDLQTSNKALDEKWQEHSKQASSTSNTLANRDALKQQIDDYTKSHPNPTDADRQKVAEMRNQYKQMMSEEKGRLKSITDEIKSNSKRETELDALKQEHYKLSKAMDNDSLLAPGSDRKLTELERKISERENGIKSTAAKVDTSTSERKKYKSPGLTQAFKSAKEMTGRSDLEIHQLAQDGLEDHYSFRDKEGNEIGRFSNPHTSKAGYMTLNTSATGDRSKPISKQDSFSAGTNERSRIRGELHAKDKAMKATMPTTVSGLRSAYADATGSMKSKIAAELRRKGYSLVGGKWVKGRKE